jgi:hypothetical protein
MFRVPGVAVTVSPVTVFSVVELFGGRAFRWSSCPVVELVSDDGCGSGLV